MRFERLAVPAFGPFTNVAFELPAAGGDFHLVYGPNEAGKSSLLRAIRDLLYGIHAQTPDAFLHDYKVLRIAATLCRRDGQRLACQRRKGNRNTLLDGAGEPLPDDALAPFLGAVDRDYFTTMFGLDAAGLRTGAAALLQGQGDLGQALFSASLAGTPVHRILDALDAEARGLFDGRTRSGVTLRPAVEAYEAELQACREATVKPEAWDAAVTALDSAVAERDRLDGELTALHTRLDWVSRCLDALPTLGRLQAATDRLAALPPGPAVPPGFVAAAQAALQNAVVADDAVAQVRQRVVRLGDQLTRLAPRQDVLDRAAEIEAVHQALPLHRGRRDELAGLDSQHEAARATLRATLRRLGLGGESSDAEALRSTLAEELAVRQAAGDFGAAADALADRDEELRRLEQERDGQLAQLAKLPSADVAALRTAFAGTEPAAAAMRGLTADEGALATAARATAQALALLRGAPEDPAAAYALPVPLAATLREFQVRADLIARRRDEALQQFERAQGALRDVAAQLERLAQRGAIPTAEGLAAARAHRDATWQQVLAAWTARVDGAPVDGVPLAQAYPRTVRAADEIADRLRDNAALVAEANELALRRAAAEADAADAAQRRAAAEQDRQAWQADWQAAWRPCGIEPGSAAEMLEWRDLWATFRAACERWSEARDRVAHAHATIADAVARLRPLVGGATTDALPALREAAERRVREADQALGRRSQIAERQARIEADLARLQADRPALVEAAERARAAWQGCCATLAIPADTDPAAGLELLAARRQAVEQHDALVALEARRRQLADATARYENDVAELADALALVPASVEVREHALWRLLQATQADAARRAQLEQQLAEEQGALADAEAAAARAAAEVARLVTLAGVATPEALRALLAQLAERQEADAAVLTHRDALQGPARGEALDAFIARVQAEDRDGLAAERLALAERAGALAGLRDEQVKAVSRCEQARERLAQAGAAAAEHLQAARHAAVRVRHDAARYLRLRLATRYLREQIEEFRRQNQGPLLRRAGEIFAAVTGGSFEALGTRFGANDQAVLVGIRDGVEVTVDGMSEGTRDQLYLALRLAAIERHGETHEPMPVILDDLLVTFDDARASAVLPLLRDLAARTQVFLFTHHRHLVELARAALPEGAVHYHELPTNDS